MKNRILLIIIALALFAGVNWDATAGTTFTYQGIVTDSGTNFNGPGLFKFALVTSTNTSSPATAAAHLTGNFVTSCTVVLEGNGYSTPPTITFSGGGGSGAAATATVSGGRVTSISVNNAGSGYTSSPTVAIAPPPDDITYVTYWSNDGTSVAGSEPTNAVDVGVSNGLFNVVLGDPTLPNMMAIPVSLFTTQPNLALRIWFNDGVNGFEALSPVQSLTSTPYAAFANTASNFSGTVPLAQLPGTVGLLNDSGTQNFFAGGNAGDLTQTGEQNAGIGYFALASNTIGSFNTAEGFSALQNNTSGSDNVANGYEALNSNTNGSENTANGVESLYENTSGGDNVANGYGALFSNSSGSDNTANGAYTLEFNTIGFFNTANGYQALNDNSTGNNNTADGWAALQNVTTGSGNIAVGQNSGTSIQTGDNNIDIGNAGSGDESNTIRIGTQGSHTKAVINGIYGASVSSGVAVVINANGLLGTTGDNNNTAIGFNALQNITTGSGNIAVGANAGTAIQTGNNNIDIGNTGFGDESGVIRIGTSQTKAVMLGIYGTTIASGGTPVYVNPSGLLGTATSSRRFKKNIRSMDDASDVLLALHPVTFQYKTELDATGNPQFGLIAEEVEKVDPALVVRDDKHQIYSVRYEAVNAMLLNEFLKQHRTVEEQEQKLTAQNTEIQSLEAKAAKVDSLEKKLDDLQALVKQVAGQK
jgi:hypothetical protein